VAQVMEAAQPLLVQARPGAMGKMATACAPAPLLARTQMPPLAALMPLPLPIRRAPTDEVR
jgi:hypothetical protein